MGVTWVGLYVQKLWAFSDAPASLALMIVCSWLTDSSKLAILHVWQFSHHPSRILSGGNICLISLVTLEGLVTICIICTLQNFLFYLAHLWTDFQSCCFAVAYCKFRPNHLMLQRWKFKCFVIFLWPKYSVNNIDILTQYVGNYLLTFRVSNFPFNELFREA